MEQRQLGKTDLKVSSIGLGCVTFGREIERDDAFEVLDHAIERGITLLDTAEAYAAGASESVLGDWISDRNIRDRVVLATKVAGSLTEQRIRESVDASLERLKSDHIDLFQLHNWDDEVPLVETLGTLDDLVKQGKIRYYGCSNWQAWQLAKSLLRTQNGDGFRMESVQPPYNLVQREIEPDLLPLCVDQQIGIISYSPLAAGFLTGKYQRGAPIPKGTRFDVIPGHQPIYFTERGYRVIAGLEKMANETGHSMIQLSLAWALARTGITSVLVGGRNPSQIDQAFDAAEVSLTKEMQDELDTLSAM